MVDLLSARIAFVTSVFGPGMVNKSSVAVNCPRCSSDRPEKKKLIIRLDNGMHHCWICDLKGKTLKYTIKKYFASRYSQYCHLFEELQDDSLTVIEEIKQVEVPKDFILLALNQKSRDPDVRSTLEYARFRGINLRDLWYFKLGTCSNGRFRRRLIMPSFDVDGKLNYFTARSIDSSKKMKYLNAKAPKKNLIFNEINIDWSKELTVVEGPMDLIKCNDNAVSILGSTLNEKYVLFQKIVKNSTPVLMALDPDAKEKMHKICQKLNSYGVETRVLDLKGYKDVGEMSKKEFAKRRNLATEWKTNDRLFHLIKEMRSGSLI